MIKKITAFFILLAASCFATRAQYADYSEIADSQEISDLKGHVNFLASGALKGRKAGSEGEKAAAEYVYRCLEEKGLDMLCSSEGDIFMIAQEDTLTSRNIAGVVQGYDKSMNERYIVIGARLDNLGSDTYTLNGETIDRIYYGANGNASGLAALIELAGKISANRFLFRRSVIFIAFGSSANTYAGAWYFLNRSFKDVDKIDAMINLDMLGTGSKDFVAYTSSNTDMNLILASAAQELQPVLPRLTTHEPYPSDHRAFYSAAIPSVLFSTGQYQEHATPADVPSIIEYENLEREIEYLYNFSRVLSCVQKAPLFNGSNSANKYDSEKIYWSRVDEKPLFYGHADPRYFLSQWVYSYMKYPQAAVDQGIQGKVEVEFAIDKKGDITEARVVRGVDPLLDAEALKVLNASPRWAPAKIGGRKVKCYMNLTIEFRLEKKKNRK